MDIFVVVPIITGVVEIIKRAGLPTRFLPLLAVALGVIVTTWSATTFSFDVVVLGVSIGLSSVGLFEGIKKPVEAGVNKLKGI